MSTHSWWDTGEYPPAARYFRGLIDLDECNECNLCNGEKFKALRLLLEKQLARRAPGGNYLAWPNQIAVNIDELNLRRRHTSLLQRRHDLVLGEALELFS